MKNFFRHSILFSAVALCSASMSADEPSGYYSSCNGLYGASLLSKLQTVVGNHTVVSYDGLWTLYRTSDTYPDGTIWDMYSTKHFTYHSQQCGSYKNVGDCYNREHSMPKSWFSQASPMVSDGFHIYPTDGKVNGQRSNYPYGECSGGTTLAGSGSVKALGRLGASTFSGYSGTVFEPDDEYKGDFARTYFYMAAAYNDRIQNWSTSGTNLGGNSYPAFNSWTVEMLLKWHRQDPVSDKEIKRNEAVYAAQNNRNPFIDHPELAEHIWGNKKTTAWNGGATDPDISLPVDGTTINIGSTMTGVVRTATLTVKGFNLTQNVSLAVTGSGFSCSPSTIAYSAANSTSGATATISFNPSATGSYSGTLKITCGSLTSTVYLTANALSTIPAGPVTGVSDDSFEAVWSYVGEQNSDGTYTLNVMQDGRTISGFPKRVPATDERYVVENLDPETTYTYTVSSVYHTSNYVSVTTLTPIPSVTVLFDGDLTFFSDPGQPSEVAELLLEIDNIDTDITLSVGNPFEISADKYTWARSVTISPEQDRIYLRMNAGNSGTYQGSLDITADGYHNDDVDFTGIVSSGFHEDFDADASGCAPYKSNVIYQGTASRWKLTNAGLDPTDPAHSGQALRFGKDDDSSIEMQDDTGSSVGTVTLWARKWSATEASATFVIDYSTDNGTSWKTTDPQTASTINYQQFVFKVNTNQPTRLRVRQTSGARWLIDDLETTVGQSGLVPEAVADYHRWDAFCRNHNLVIETDEDIVANVFSLDGSELFSGRVAAGSLEIALPAGLYIVAVDDFARRVLVK